MDPDGSICKICAICGVKKPIKTDFIGRGSNPVETKNCKQCRDLKYEGKSAYRERWKEAVDNMEAAKAAKAAEAAKIKETKIEAARIEEARIERKKRQKLMRSWVTTQPSITSVRPEVSSPPLELEYAPLRPFVSTEPSLVSDPDTTQTKEDLARYILSGTGEFAGPTNGGKKRKSRKIKSRKIKSRKIKSRKRKSRKIKSRKRKSRKRKTIRKRY